MAVAVLASAACTDGGADRGLPAPTTTAPTTTAHATTGTGCPPGDGRPATHRYAERPGTDPHLTSLDVYLPEGCGPFPVVVWVHGGGWRVGDQRNASTAQHAAWANELGMAWVSVGYRLSTPGSGVAWPDHGDDVADAVAWVRHHAAELGVDPDRLALAGHSAGAHLVSIVATDPALRARADLPTGAPTCVVALDTAAYRLDTVAPAMRPMVTDAFGTDPGTLADASPLLQAQRNGSVGSRFLVVTRGTAARRSEADSFAATVRAGGGGATVVDARPLTHAEVNRDLGRTGEQVVTPATAAFLRDCLAT